MGNFDSDVIPFKQEVQETVWRGFCVLVHGIINHDRTVVVEIWILIMGRGQRVSRRGMAENRRPPMAPASEKH